MTTVNQKSISDAEILEFILDGSLVVDLRTASVQFRGRALAKTIVGTEGKNGERYRVEINYNRRRRSIVLGKLVYMAGNHVEIEGGYEVHHVDLDRFNDAFDNLVLVTVDDHKKLHGTFDYDKRRRPSVKADEDVPF